MPPIHSGRFKSLRHTAPKAPHGPNLGPEHRNHCGIPHPKPCTDRTWGPNTVTGTANQTHNSSGVETEQVAAIRASRREGVRTYRNQATAALATSTRPV